MLFDDDPATIFRDGRFCAPGYRFHPTDEELVLYYLKRKICRKRLLSNVIAETDVYKWEPEELPGLSLLKTGDRQWFFFSRRDRKYPNGGRAHRATRNGYWKATGKDRNITCYSRSVGLKKTLVFYRGRAPSGERTDWVMHEYTLDEQELKRCQNVKDLYALCKVYKKSGPGPKNGEQYGAEFREEDWVDDGGPEINSSADQEISVKQAVEVVSNENVKDNSDVHSALTDIEEFMKQIADEALLDLPQINNYTYSVHQAFSEEETQSTLVDQCSREVICPEPVGVFNPNDQQCNVQASFDFTQSANSQMQPYETSEVTTCAPIQEQDPPMLREEDFLEIDDLIGPEPTISRTENALENLQFEELDGLSEIDLYHDAAMFLHDMGPIDQGTVSHHQYMNSLGDDIIGQFDYQLQPNSAAVDQVIHQLNLESTQFNNQLNLESTQFNNQLNLESTQFNNQLNPESSQFNNQLNLQSTQFNSQLNPESTQFNDQLNSEEVEFNNHMWTHIERAEQNQESLPYSTSGVVYESSNFPSQENQNQRGNEATGAASQFSSALWAFVESIPTTPASASENALVNRAFERMSSFSRLRNVAAGNRSETVRADRKMGFFFLPVLVALCAIFWLFMTTLRPWWRCLST